ncbi:MAG TPA: hypothetical protein VLS45_03955, partial [Methylomicrobium sp.]|nr:hypothetical protein [Methylomicrobium sp.]
MPAFLLLDPAGVGTQRLGCGGRCRRQCKDREIASAMAKKTRKRLGLLDPAYNYMLNPYPELRF